jgi:hypothetical protein
MLHKVKDFPTGAQYGVICSDSDNFIPITFSAYF